MPAPTNPGPAPDPVSRILQALAPHAVSEENLYLHFSRLSNGN
jgi:hypothetical protein